jgi:hypothetical protein
MRGFHLFVCHSQRESAFEASTPLGKCHSEDANAFTAS